MKNFTISDLSRDLKISKSTISKVVNSYPDVSDKTRKTVLEYIKKVGYVPNAHASYLRTKESKTVGVILPELNNNFFNSILDGIISSAQKSDYGIFIECSRESIENEKKIIYKFLNLNVDAIFLSVSMETKEIKHLQNIKKENKSLILFHEVKKSVICPKILLNNRKLAFDVTERLVLNGFNDLNVSKYPNPFLPSVIKSGKKMGKKVFDVFLKEYDLKKNGRKPENKIYEIS